MSLSDLTSEEHQIIKQCLDAVVSGEIIFNDWEFRALFGITFDELRTVADAWPDVDDADDLAFLAINGAMNNLLGYPHKRHHLWSKYISVPQSEVLRIFRKWKNKDIRSYFDGACD